MVAGAFHLKRGRREALPFVPFKEKNQKTPLPEWPDPIWPFVLAAGLFLLNFVLQQTLYTLFSPYFDETVLKFVLTLLQTALLTLPLIFIVKNRFHYPLSALGFSRAPFWPVVGRGFLGGVLIYLLILAVSVVSALFFAPPQELQPLMQSLGVENVFIKKFMLILIVVVLAPFSEEVFYRGFLYDSLRKYLGAFWGTIGAGVIFGLIHLQLAYLLPLSLTGVALCRLYEKQGNIWVNILAHAVFNGISVVRFFGFSNFTF